MANKVSREVVWGGGGGGGEGGGGKGDGAWRYAFDASDPQSSN